jgi:hypothetical protein
MAKINEALNIEIEVQASQAGRYEYLVEVDGFRFNHKIEVFIRRDCNGQWYWGLLRKECPARLSEPVQVEYNHSFVSKIREGSTKCERRWEATKQEAIDIMLKELKRVHCAVAFATWS